ncbi:MAG: OmpA family protein [Pseudomonadota bacterium]
MRLSTFAPLVLTFGAAGAIAFGAATVGVRLLETGSRDDVALQMNVSGHDWAEVQADGLQVIISGEAPSEATRFNALSVAGSVVDAARVIDNMSVTDSQQVTAPRFSIEMLRNEAGVSLIGLIPQSSDRDVIAARVARAAGGVPVTDLLETADYAAPEDWDIAVAYALRALGDLPRSKISVEADLVAITAITDSDQERRQVEGQLARNAPASIRTALDISAPRPVITPFTLRFLIDAGGARFDACSADTDAAQRQITAAAIEAGLEGKADCRLGLGSPTTRWGDAAAAAITAVAELGTGSVTFSDTDVTFVATQGTEPAAFDTVTAELEQNLPDIFALTAVLPEPETQSEDGPPEFTATLSPEGQVQMRGHVGDDLARAAVETYAQSRFGAEQAYLAAEDRESLPSGWSLRVLGGLAGLSQLSNGSVVVSDANVTVRGETGNPDARARIAQILSDQLGEGQPFSINVAYSEALDPAANILTPEECVERVNLIIAERKITFEPSSTTLDANSRQTIAAIAEVLRECADIQMEVAGHTDSQGREEMNLNLSQSRAEAVIAALQGERIAAPGLIARGYGEARPIADNETEAGREANRRIEFTLRTPQEEPAADTEAAPEEETPSE